jgi:hypothetical protein
MMWCRALYYKPSGALRRSLSSIVSRQRSPGVVTIEMSDGKVLVTSTDHPYAHCCCWLPHGSLLMRIPGSRRPPFLPLTYHTPPRDISRQTRSRHHSLPSCTPRCCCMRRQRTPPFTPIPTPTHTTLPLTLLGWLYCLLALSAYFVPGTT